MKQIIASLQEKPMLPVFIAIGLALFTTLTWLFVIIPIEARNSALQSAAPEQEKELASVRSQVGRIIAYEEKLSDEQKAITSQSPLQQVEQLARLNGVAGQMTQISPMKVQLANGTMSEGLSIEFQGSSLIELTPFLHAVVYDSLMQVTSLEFRKNNEERGGLNARVTLATN